MWERLPEGGHISGKMKRPRTGQEDGGSGEKTIVGGEKSMHKGLEGKTRGILERRPVWLDHVLFSLGASLKSAHRTFWILPTYTPYAPTCSPHAHNLIICSRYPAPLPPHSAVLVLSSL